MSDFLGSDGFFGSSARNFYGHDPAARSRINSVKAHFQLVEARFERLKMVNQAVWELLKERTSLEEKDLVDRIQEIDLRDGKEDQKHRPEAYTCTECNRTLKRGNNRCMYCGHQNEIQSVFDWV